jgi:hypothetical protein
MSGDQEILALVLGDAKGPMRPVAFEGCGAQRLVRDPDGHMSLEDITSREEFERTARNTGCFRRGKAIRDPKTDQIIGYEMEEVPWAQATAF